MILMMMEGNVLLVLTVLNKCLKCALYKANMILMTTEGNVLPVLCLLQHSQSSPFQTPSS